MDTPSEALFHVEAWSKVVLTASFLSMHGPCAGCQSVALVMLTPRSE